MPKLFLNVKVEKIHSYETPGYGYNSGYETHYVYNMLGEDGRTYVWKTAQVMRIFNRCMDCSSRINNRINEGDFLFISGSFRGESEYKGVPQILINRVEVKERMFAAPSPKEQIEMQLNSVRPQDKIVTMHYGKYKKDYSDCEVIKNSYDSQNKTIGVIVRDYASRK